MVEMDQKGRIEFITSNEVWNEGFVWAKNQALAYSHEGDLVGSWYEAALPDREAFCMRDVSHQSKGAEALGLREHTKNMLLRFAQGIAESRQFCSFWEIDRNYRPCPADYTSDRDFWYNLPANFDVMDACYRMYSMTGDPDYLFQSDFVRFYQMTVEEYAQWWDVDGDGLLERKHPGSRLGIPSYCEDSEFKSAQALIDLLAIEIRGYRSAAKLFAGRKDERRSAHCERMAEKLSKLLSEQWWDEKERRYYQVKAEDGTLRHSDMIGHELSLCYYQVIEEEERLCRHLERLHAEALKGINVESLSHYPAVFYRSGQPGRGAGWLKALISPELCRREYPEVSYAVVETFIYEMAGVHPDGPGKAVRILPQLPEEISWFRLKNLPFLNGELDVSQAGDRLSVMNRTGQRITVNDREVGAGESITIESVPRRF